MIAAAFIAIQAISRLYPFGETSNLIWDLDIQYVDYFAYLKDVLLGKASVGYSFSKSMGGSLVALFGYYLASPLNLFVVFFSKEQLPMFVFLLTVVKLGLSGATASIFFRYRFKKLSDQGVTGLAVAYGLMQYMMIHLSNIMWLDGVILLPIILLGVYKLVYEKKKSMLYFSILALMVFNWYTGYMAGLFAACYYLYERINQMEAFNGKEILEFIKDGIRFGIVMILGVLGSCFLFYPVFKGLQNGKSVYNPDIFNFAAYDSFIDVFRGFTVGSIMGTVSLYCGLLFFGFFVYYFFSRKIQLKEKILSLIAAAFMFLSCWFIPLDCIWSGFRFVASYRFRYSFVFVFLVLFLAAKGMEVYEADRKNRLLPVIFAGCALFFLYLQHRQPFDMEYKVWLTVAVLVIYAVVFLLHRYPRLQNGIFAVLLLAELIMNGVFTFQNNYSWATGEPDYVSYVDGEEKLVDDVKEYDDSEFFRMDTTSKRDQAENMCSAILNESMVYGYSCLGHYSSTFDSSLSDMLFYLGYSTEFDLSIFGESILPSDSLLGVKYMLSSKDVAGYRKVDSINSQNGKDVYENPFALGIGYLAADSVTDTIKNENPFEFQNQLFSNLLGEETEVFKEVVPTESLVDENLTYTFDALGGDDLLYGKVDTYNDEADIPLHVDGVYQCSYANWLSYQVFYVGNTAQAHQVSLPGYAEGVDTAKESFYYLDMETFRAAIEKLRTGELDVTTVEDGHVEGTVTAPEDGKLLLSIPYDEGWRITVNGKEVTAEAGANALTAVPVEKGSNEIMMEYQVPGMKVGILLTIVSLGIFGAWCFLEKRKYIQCVKIN